MPTTTHDAGAIETLQEYVTSRGAELAVDNGGGLIRGVKILGLESKNGRTYPLDTLKRASPLYEDAKVNVNHPVGDPSQPRAYQDRMGIIRGVVVREDGLYGDLYYNPNHSVAKQLEWDAEHAPENVGLSHNVQARIARRGTSVIVEEISRVQSVDLVADPATTGGLFEETISQEEEDADMADLTMDQLQADRPDLVQRIREGAVKAVSESAERKAETAATEKELAELKEANKTLTEKVDRHEAAAALVETQKAVDKEIEDAKLPKALVTEVFRDSMYGADDDGRKKLIEDRQTIAKLKDAGQPVSTEQRLAEGQAATMSTKDVMSAIT